MKKYLATVFIFVCVSFLHAESDASKVIKAVIPEKGEKTASVKRLSSMKPLTGSLLMLQNHLNHLQRETREALKDLQIKAESTPPGERERVLRKAVDIKRHLEIRTLEIKKEIAILKGDKEKQAIFSLAIDKLENPGKYRKKVKEMPRANPEGNSSKEGLQ